MKLETMPFDLTVGDSYTDGFSIRRIEAISIKSDTIKYIENPDGGHVLGLCSINSFFDWIDGLKY